MKNQKWSKIIAGEATSSVEVKAEIQNLKNEIEFDTILDDLNKSLIQMKKEALAGATQKGIKPLENRINRMKDEIKTKEGIIEDLSVILKTTMEIERKNRLVQIDKEIAELRDNENKLNEQFIESLSKAAVIWFLIKGKPFNLHPVLFVQPYEFGTPRHKTLHNTIREETNGKISIFESIEKLEKESYRLR